METKEAMSNQASREEEDENLEDEDSEASSDEDEGSTKKALQALTCRKVTLSILMEDGIIEAGEGVLTIDYLGQKFEADLLPSGKIRWQGSEEEFGTPSAWALHCKRLVNPIKRSGCGWASVKYKNKKLDMWKSMWARKQRQSTSSKSPQVSPGLRLSTTSSPGLASPATPKGGDSAHVAGNSPGVTSPSSSSTAASTTTSPHGTAVASSSNAVLASSSTSTLPSLPPSSTTATAAASGSSVLLPPTSSKGGEQQDSNLNTSTTSQSLTPSLQKQPQQSSPPTSKSSPDGNSSSKDESVITNLGTTETSASTSARTTDKESQDKSGSPSLGITEKLGKDGTADPDGSVSTKKLPGVNQSSPSTSEQISIAGSDQSPPKKAKKEDTITLNLSRELPSPTPGPLPPKAVLHQVSPAVTGQEARSENPWEGFYQQQLQQHHEPLGKTRQSVSYSSLGQRGLDVDPFMLIKCEHFDSLSKIQPFTVSVTSNSLLLMDFHCHLTKSEVVGYLGGRWDCQRQHLSIEQAFPARCRLGDKDRSSAVEEEIRRSMRQKGLMVVGWYHSHPTCSPDPSIRDIDCQMAYQLRMRGSGAIYLPCVGFILSPFEKLPPKQDSKIQCFWVMPNLEHPTSFNIPMHVGYSTVRDLSLTEDLLADLKRLTEFYSGAVDKVYLREKWGEAITYLDKIKASLRTKLPEDQLNSHTFLDYMQQLMTDMK